MDLDKIIVEVRKENGFSQKDCANYIKCDLHSYQEKEYCKAQFTDVELYLLSKMFNCKIADLRRAWALFF